MSFHPDKTFMSMSEAEIKAATKLTAKEQRALTDLYRAVRRLPLGITLEVDDDGLTVRKQITYGYYHCVGALKRKTLRDGRKAKPFRADW